MAARTKASATPAEQEPAIPAEKSPKSPKPRREIPGSFTYTTSFGTLKRALDGITVAERPDKFSSDFMATVLKVTGGSAKPIPPILKRMVFLSSDGNPTELYSKFKSENNRSGAALDGLKRGFPEIFRHNDYAHRATKEEIVDLIVQITGLNKKDQIVNATSGTFEAIRSFVNKDQPSTSQIESNTAPADAIPLSNGPTLNGGSEINLAYNINIILPESTNIQVFNAIFQSLKNNLLR
ncbi:DUF5343 domain-containing protein [Methylobacterium symbioticum]|uniref:DUF5343 domain-containing protein n=1 Tax=Methylobacterium symbioticum TaxID=2584084 RepID=A0A509E981_9HYPH|nr:DUF5343 domain-containing protein [Methylobacterium symbioticum]VUD70730.1 hypothetical protein MET9862_01303 [Methylobacterium symbioticum]